MQDTNSVDTASSRTNAAVALGISAVALVVYIIAMLMGDDAAPEWLWPVAGILGLVGAVMGWMAGKPRPAGKAMAAVVLGGLVFVVILGWIIWAMATGNF